MSLVGSCQVLSRLVESCLDLSSLTATCQVLLSLDEACRGLLSLANFKSGSFVPFQLHFQSQFFSKECASMNSESYKKVLENGH